MIDQDDEQTSKCSPARPTCSFHLSFDREKTNQILDKRKKKITGWRGKNK